MARWRDGAVALCRGATVPRWRDGAVARWRGGAVPRGGAQVSSRRSRRWLVQLVLLSLASLLSASTLALVVLLYRR
jgi:hypothetical protein